ncbi:MAG: glycoside hydrolase family 3 C-terminal domain-containing protein [Chloroflexota bacterium]
MNPLTPSVETKIEQLLAQMTLVEKCALLSGLDTWQTVPIPRLGIPSLVMTDGPHGVRATPEGGRKVQPATSFPTGFSMAASWDSGLIEQVGQALAEETLALGCDVLLGPCVNIVRHPLAGRNFEAYSEDPHLSAEIGAAWVRGAQSRGVAASLKHFALNEQETERFRGSSEVDERAMREIYLSQFERIVKQAHPWTVMCAYNRINGVYASQNETLLRRILKKEWAYDGAVISDWRAVHATVEPVRAGLDLEMPGPARWFGELLVEAVLTWQLEPEWIDDAARRVLRLLARVGKLDNQPRPAGSINTPEHQALARRLAEESITLLKNENALLPLDPARLNSLAVIGPFADTAAIGGGGSSYLQPPYRVSPLDGLRAALPASVEIRFEPGCDAYHQPPVLDPALLTPASGEGSGLFGEYFASADFSGAPVLQRVDSRLDYWTVSFAPLEATPRPFSVRWSGMLIPRFSGTHTFRLQNTGSCRVFVGEREIVANANDHQSPVEAPPAQAGILHLQAGQAYPLRVEYVCPAGLDHTPLTVFFGYTPLPGEDERLERAIRAAQTSDAVVIFAGYPEGYESEGYDRPAMSLTGAQDELVARVAAVNANTIVVLHCASPVLMPWINAVKTVLFAGYSGQEGGNALTRLLLGQVNPSGRLPVSFPRRLEDTPAYNTFPGSRKVHYGEGVFVGYRHYDYRQVEPLFPFGHGLSYTIFEYTALDAPARAQIGEAVEVRLTIRNSGGQRGKETVQLYVHDCQASLPRPPRELKAFAKVELEPGESRALVFHLDERAFAFYHPDLHRWLVEPGEFEISAGSSSRDLRLSRSLVLSHAA